MQQLFGLINEVLAHSPATAKRRLRIVTYKVTSSDSALKLATANSRHPLFCLLPFWKPFRQPVVAKVHLALHTFWKISEDSSLRKPATWTSGMAVPQVVPFSPAAGLLEWVEETVPLGRYLIGEDRQSGAHKRYARPGDLSFYDCYTTIDKGQRDGRPRQAFDKVTRNCSPLKTGQCVCMMSSSVLKHRASSSPKSH